MKTFERAPLSINARLHAVIAQYHKELQQAEVTIDLLVVSDDSEGHALMHGGYPADAVVRIIGLKDRVKGHADAEITLDEKAWKAMTPAEQDALLDHELYHLIVRFDEEGNIRTDDAHRPKLRMRKHDYQFGWFVEIARRHKGASGEVQQALLIKKQAGQILFDFIEEATAPAVLH